MSDDATEAAVLGVFFIEMGRVQIARDDGKKFNVPPRQMPHKAGAVADSHFVKSLVFDEHFSHARSMAADG